MKKLCSVVILCSALLGGQSNAATLEVSFQQNAALTPAIGGVIGYNFGGSFSELEFEFDDNLGTLTGIDFEAQYTATNLSAEFENDFFVVPISYYPVITPFFYAQLRTSSGSIAQLLDLEYSENSEPLLTLSPGQTAVRSIADQTLSLQGSIDLATASPTVAVTLNNPSGFNVFVDDSLTFCGQRPGEPSSGCPIGFDVNLLTGSVEMSGKLTFTYDEAPALSTVPLPSSLPLLALGLALPFAIQRRLRIR